MSNILYGIHPVTEAITSGRKIEKVILKQGFEGPQARALTSLLKEYEIPYEDPERFLDENRQFVCVFEKCFSTIEKKYNINISVSEIAYLHDYIKNGFIYTQGRKDRK
ncbi:MAG: PRD domain-containing protein [Bacteroidales bacterium]|nr:PRD domain-containing protein [Bacteroidales bacterium]